MNDNIYQLNEDLIVETYGTPINQGGFGSIYNCRVFQKGIELKGEYVLKKLKSEQDSQIIPERFKREMSYMQNLDHQNILKPLIVCYENLFIVMKKFPKNLLDYIQSENFDFNEAKMIFSTILDACGHYMAEGIIHRDLKPENVLLDSNNNPIITDFGISGRINRTETESITQVGEVIGTLFYTAPEQLRELKEADLRSDIYSLGKILMVMAFRDLHGYFKYSQISLINEREFETGIRLIIKRATAIDPEKRYQNIGELKRAIQLSLSPDETLTPNYLRLIEMLVGEDRDLKLIEYEFCELINKDFEEKVDLFEKLTTNQHKELCSLNVEVYEKFIETVVNEIGHTSYPWTYVDTLVDKIISLLINLNEVIDLDIQIKMIISGVHVSTYHNRFPAMISMGEFINDIESPDLKVNLLESLGRREKSELKTIREYRDGSFIKILTQD